MKKFLLSAALAASFGTTALSADLGAVDEPIKLAINEWTGQHITTHIAGDLLEKLGYKVEYVTAGNYPQHTALGEGELAASLEVWSNNTGDIYPKMKAAGKIVDIGPVGLEAREGWVYPKHMESVCPGLPDWHALIECQGKLATGETFPDGRILSYPADWGTRSADMIKGLALPYKAVPAGSEGALVAELKAAATAKTPLVMMLWAPHWVFADVDVGWVDLPKFEEACATDPAWGPNPNEVNDCGVAAPETLKVAWSGFAKKWPAAYKLLEAYQINTADQEAMMKKVDQEGQALEAVTAAWVDSNQAVWGPWVEAAKN